MLEGTRAGGATSDLYALDAAGIHVVVKGGALAVREPLARRPCAVAVPEIPATGELPLGDEGGADDAAGDEEAAPDAIEDDERAADSDEAMPPTESPTTPKDEPKDTLPDVDDEP